MAFGACTALRVPSAARKNIRGDQEAGIEGVISFVGQAFLPDKQNDYL